MLINLLLGFLTISACLLMQSMLLLAAMRYYHRHQYLVDSPSFVASMVVIGLRVWGRRSALDELKATSARA